MPQSKAFASFKNKVLHFNDDIELVDILYATIKHQPANYDDRLFDFQDRSKHLNISRYKNCQENRLMVVQHLKSTIYSAYVKDVYEELTIYLKSIILEAYENAKVDPKRIIGEHKVNMSAVDILAGIHNGTLAQTIIENMFQALENERSTITLIKKSCTKLGISVKDELIDDAVYYLEIRHKLVHTDGYADEEFRKKHKSLRYTARGYIDLSYPVLQSMRNSLLALVGAIDEDALKKEIINPHT